ncbi:MAG TPA: extracellular solute-binding protein, partial [Beijerinckiaceae bacterium]|nr:extracellular solute-binding protein [Beijerinckiaceae bacterium]
TWYTSLIVDQFARPAADAFEKAYGIKVDFVRADSAEIGLRLLNESKAGHVQADVFDGFGAPALVKAGIVASFIPDPSKSLPPQFHDPDGHWAATNLYVLTPGYNTDLVPKGTEPKTFQDLLDPKWKDKMAWNSQPSSAAGPGFVGLVLADMGEEKGTAYLTALAKQKIAGLKVSARQVLDQVIAGEYAIAIQIFDNHAVISKAQGAPVDWIAMNPAMGVLSVFSVTQGAPHPNAARLFVDYLTSSDGQKLFRDADYIPVDPAVPPKVPSLRPDGDKFKAIYFTPENYDASLPKWTKLFNDLFQ